MTGVERREDVEAWFGEGGFEPETLSEILRLVRESDADVDMAGAAALVHRSKGRFQKAWRRLVASEGFPRPFVGAQKGGQPWWRIADIEAWKAAKAAGLAQPTPATGGNLPQRHAPIQAANDPVATEIPPGDLAAQLLAAAGG